MKPIVIDDVVDFKTGPLTDEQRDLIDRWAKEVKRVQQQRKEDID